MVSSTRDRKRVFACPPDLVKCQSAHAFYAPLQFPSNRVEKNEKF